MTTTELTEANFSQVVDAGGIVLVDFWAIWCGPCRAFAPIFEEASEQNQDITFGKVDTDSEIRLAQAHDIKSIPTLMAIRDGVIVFSQAGALPKPSLDEVIAKVRDLDMEQVRAEVAKQAS